MRRMLVQWARQERATGKIGSLSKVTISRLSARQNDHQVDAGEARESLSSSEWSQMDHTHRTRRSGDR